MSRGGKRDGAGRKAGDKDSPKKFISKQARKYGEEALKTLVKNMADDNGTISNAAAKTILEYGFGKPNTEITGEAGGPISVEVILEFISSQNTDT